MAKKNMKVAVGFCLFFLFAITLSECQRIHYWRRTSVANRYFAHTLFQRVARTTPVEKNVILSPYAVSAGLSMVLYGSDGNTADELVQTLEYTEIDDAKYHTKDDPHKHIRIARLYQKMKEQLIDIDHGFLLNAPNRLFVDNREQIQPGYVEGMERFFGTPTASLDFLHDPATAIEEINNFVSTATNGTITEAVTAETISSQTCAVFVSTLYFKADWLHPFDPSLTHRDNFQLINGDTIEVEYMKSALDVDISEAFGECEGCLHARYVELPYKTTSSKYKMVMELILPNAKGEDALRDLESTLDEGTLYYSTQRKYKDMVMVKLPKFALEYTKDLTSDLKHMGIHDIFDPNQADLSLINGKKNLFFDSARHQTFLKVDEKGTTASASFSLSATRSNNYIAFDRPFLLIIREAYTKMPLFMARIVNPIA